MMTRRCWLLAPKGLEEKEREKEREGLVCVATKKGAAVDVSSLIHFSSWPRQDLGERGPFLDVLLTN